jgi:hypothetical protein
LVAGQRFWFADTGPLICQSAPLDRLSSLNHTFRNLVPTFPQRASPQILP